MKITYELKNRHTGRLTGMKSISHLGGTFFSCNRDKKYLSQVRCLT